MRRVICLLDNNYFLCTHKAFAAPVRPSLKHGPRDLVPRIGRLLRLPPPTVSDEREYASSRDRVAYSISTAEYDIFFCLSAAHNRNMAHVPTRAHSYWVPR